MRPVRRFLSEERPVTAGESSASPIISTPVSEKNSLSAGAVIVGIVPAARQQAGLQRIPSDRVVEGRGHSGGRIGNFGGRTKARGRPRKLSIASGDRCCRDEAYR